MLIKIIPYAPQHAQDFRRIGEEWINEFLQLEEPDISVLNDPKTNILDRGGFIFMAEYMGDIVGTAALVKKSNGRYELVKLGVTKRARGLGIGRLLVEYVIEKAKALELDKLYLESSQKLEKALALYRALGFTDLNEANRTPQCDVQMVLSLK